MIPADIQKPYSHDWGISPACFIGHHTYNPARMEACSGKYSPMWPNGKEADILRDRVICHCKCHIDLNLKEGLIRLTKRVNP